MTILTDYLELHPNSCLDYVFDILLIKYVDVRSSVWNFVFFLPFDCKLEQYKHRQKSPKSDNSVFFRNILHKDTFWAANLIS